MNDELLQNDPVVDSVDNESVQNVETEHGDTTILDEDQQQTSDVITTAENENDNEVLEEETDLINEKSEEADQGTEYVFHSDLDQEDEFQELYNSGMPLMMVGNSLEEEPALTAVNYGHNYNDAFSSIIICLGLIFGLILARTVFVQNN